MARDLTIEQRWRDRSEYELAFKTYGIVQMSFISRGLQLLQIMIDENPGCQGVLVNPYK